MRPRSTTFSRHPSAQTNVVWSVDEDLRASQLSQLRPVKGEQAFNDEEFKGGKVIGIKDACVSGKIIDWPEYCLPAAERMNLIDEKLFI